jgi:VanZ family protein
MRPDSWIPRFAALAVIAAGLIYGSLYPWVFRIPTDGAGPVQALLRTWASPPERGDFLANVVLYLPFGYFCVRAFPAGMRARWRFTLAFLTGAILSCGIELLQYYDPGRVPSAGDVYTNISGTALGAAAALFFGRDIRVSVIREIRSRPFPALLIVSWLGYRLYPYVPTINLHKYWDALKPIVLHPEFTLYNSFRYTVMWLTLGALLETIAGQGRSLRLFVLLAAGVLFAKILIISQAVNPDEVVGIIVGFVIWSALLKLPSRARAVLVALPLFVYILLWRLEPFQFGDVARPFGWVPFYSLLNGSLAVNTESYLEKVFYYGSLLWLMGEAGLPFLLSGLILGSFLLAASGAEIYLPGRSAEVTDAIMALIIAFLASHLRNKTDSFPARKRRRRKLPDQLGSRT